MLASAEAYDPTAAISGVLVQEMVKPGREMIVGMSHDAQFGPAIAIGLGGIFVEALKDVALGIPPIDEFVGRSMIERLRARKVLEGTRGQPPADISSVLDILSRFSQLCTDLGDEVEEIDINPLVVFDEGQGAKVVDCLIVPRQGTGE